MTSILESDAARRTSSVLGQKAPDSILGVLGGKGGMGKTNVATNLAIAAAQMNARVLLVDGDLGLANVDVLLGIVPRRTSAEVLAGTCTLADAIVTGPGGVHVLPSATARMDLAASQPLALTSLLATLLSSGFAYDLVVVDVGAGIGPTVLSLASVCDRALLVTTPEPTSLTDAYATLKVLGRTARDLPIELLVNSARDELQAHATHEQLDKITRRFLGRPIDLRGWIPRDPRVEDAVAAQQAVVQAYPTAPASRSLIRLASDLIAPVDTNTTASWKRIES